MNIAEKIKSYFDLQAEIFAALGYVENWENMPMNIAEKIKSYFDLRAEIFAAIGYVENWAYMPMDDATNCWWYLKGTPESPEEVVFGSSDVRSDLDEERYFCHEVYRQRHLTKWVYRMQTHTMVVANTHADLNRVLLILDNSKEVTAPELVERIRDET